MKVEIIPAEIKHVDYIAAQVREADQAELLAFGYTPAQAIKVSMNASDFTLTGLIDDIPVCIFGVSPVSALGNVGRPWMIGTSLIDKHSLLFLRRCRPVVKRMLYQYDKLENYVDVRNVRAIQWLKWLGFSFSEPEIVESVTVPVMRFCKEYGR